MQNAESEQNASEASDTPPAVPRQHSSGTTRTTATHALSPLTPQSQIANRKSQILFPLLLEKIPFFAVAAVASVVTFVVQQHGGAVMAAESLPFGARSGTR